MTAATFGSTIELEMAYLLQRILVERDGTFLFVVSGNRYPARTDMGVTRGQFEDLCRAFAMPREREKVSKGWQLGLADEWRRRPNITRQGRNEYVRFLHFKSPNGALIVLDFYFKSLPMQIVNELKAFLASFGEATTTLTNEGEENAEGQLRRQPVSEAERDSPAEGGRREHVQVGEGGSGQLGAGDGLAEGRWRQDSARWIGLEVDDAG